MIRGGAYTFKILRYDAKKPDIPPAFASYRISVIPGLTVLAVLIRIRDEIDGTLSFRSSCRSAVCGSCAMVINGHIDLACRTQVASFDTDAIILEPLPNLEIIKDLVVDLTPFWNAYEQIRPWLVRLHEDPEKEVPQSEEERSRIDRYVNCILCASCYGACPVIARGQGYMGPHSFAKLERFILDSRDERGTSVLEEINDSQGLWGCDIMLRCIDACPKNVRPTDSIVGLRKSLLRRKLFGRGKDEA